MLLLFRTTSKLVHTPNLRIPRRKVSLSSPVQSTLPRWPTFARQRIRRPPRLIKSILSSQHPSARSSPLITFAFLLTEFSRDPWSHRNSGTDGARADVWRSSLWSYVSLSHSELPLLIDRAGLTAPVPPNTQAYPVGYKALRSVPLLSLPALS